MSDNHHIEVFEYVNRSYEEVKACLVASARDVFHKATQSAHERSRGVATSLSVNVAGLDVGAEVELDVQTPQETKHPSSMLWPMLTVQIDWKAAEHAGLFPTMQGELRAFPLGKGETQLQFVGDYEPPLGILGRAIDAVVGHRIAEASVHHLMKNVTDYLREVPASA